MRPRESPELVSCLRSALYLTLVINTQMLKLASFLLLLAFGKLASVDIDLVHRLPPMLTD